MTTTHDSAQTLALQALAWLAEDPELLGAFLAETGLSSEQLRSLASEPDLLAAVVDFVMQDDARVSGFALAAGVAPATVAQARQALPGGVATHWT